MEEEVVALILIRESCEVSKALEIMIQKCCHKL